MKVIRVYVLFIFYVLFLPTLIISQQFFNNPESVVFDSNQDRYFISNKGDGKIVQIDSNGVKSFFNTDRSSCRGIHIYGNRLYAACDAGVAVISLEDGTTVNVVDIPDRQFLNDITSDTCGNLYVTDTKGNKIYKIRIKDFSSTVFVKSGIYKPNGIFYDKKNDRLLLCSFTTDSPIQAISLKDSSVSTLISTNLDKLDGITMDGKGSVYVSSWGSGSVYRFSPDFSGNPEVVSSGHNGPADIYYNIKYDVLVVPNFNSNTVDFIPMSGQGIDEDYGYIPYGPELGQNFPNPFNSITFIPYYLEKSGYVKVRIFDLLGNDIVTLDFKYQTEGRHVVEFDGGNLPSGVYFYQVDLGGIKKVRRMILLR